jgi:hypothetical protein
LLIDQGLIRTTTDLIKDPSLSEAIYLDWLRCGQVGCVFAQLLGRPRNRSILRTVVLDSAASDMDFSELAEKINVEVQLATQEADIEGLSVLFPSLLSIEDVVLLVKMLGSLSGWRIETFREWRSLVIVGLRVLIADDVWAEIVGLGPFPQYLPPTRHSPVTALEIRTKPARERKSRTLLNQRAAHLANMRTESFLSIQAMKVRRDRWTPWLRNKMLS